MTYQQLIQSGYLITEEQVKANSALVLKQYQLALEQIQDKLGALYAKAADGGVKKADMYNWVIQYDRLTSLQKQIEAIYTKYDKKAAVITEYTTRMAMANQYYRDQFALSWTAPITFSALDQNLINYAITGEVEAWKQIGTKLGQASDWVPAAGTISDIIKKNRVKALEDIMTQINAGLINGESYASIAARVATIIGEITGTEASGQYANALRIVITEGHRAQEMGQLAAGLEAEQQGVKIVRRWDATLDPRTRAEHAAADGKEVGLDEPFIVGGEPLMYPGDPSGRPSNTIRCRCVVLTLADGFEPTARRARNPDTGETEVLSDRNFDTWAKDNGLKSNQYGELYA